MQNNIIHAEDYFSPSDSNIIYLDDYKDLVRRRFEQNIDIYPIFVKNGKWEFIIPEEGEMLFREVDSEEDYRSYTNQDVKDFFNCPDLPGEVKIFFLSHLLSTVEP